MKRIMVSSRSSIKDSKDIVYLTKMFTNAEVDEAKMLKSVEVKSQDNQSSPDS